VHDAREKHKRQQAGSKRNGEISIKKINGEKRRRISTSRSRSRLDLSLWYSVNLPIIYVFLMLSALLNWSAAGRLRASREVLTRARDRLIMIVAMSAVPPSPQPRKHPGYTNTKFDNVYEADTRQCEKTKQTTQTQSGLHMRRKPRDSEYRIELLPVPSS
jgi:hypothetical protein